MAATRQTGLEIGVMTIEDGDKRSARHLHPYPASRMRVEGNA